MNTTNQTVDQFEVRVAHEGSHSASRRPNLPALYNRLSKWCIYLSFFLIPLFFLPFSLDVLEVSKQSLFVLLSFVGLMALIGYMLTSKKFVLRKGWLNILPLLLIISVLISTVVSGGGFMSWVGEASQEYTSFLSLLSYCVFFYLVANAGSDTQTQRSIVFAIIASCFFAFLAGFLQLLGVQTLPFEFASSQAFNTIGTVNSLGVFASVYLVLASALWIASYQSNGLLVMNGKKGIAEKIMLFSASLLSLAILIVLDYWVLWALCLFGLLVLFALALVRATEFKQTNKFTLPMSVFVVSLLLLFVATPVRLGFPTEIMPSFGATFSIAKNSLSDTSALFGSGPGTFSYDYAKYRSQDLNATQFWSVKFDRGNSHALTMIATLGVVWFILWMILVLSLVFSAMSRLIRERSHEEWRSTFVFFCAFAVLILSKFLYSSNFVLEFLFWGIAGVLASQVLVKVKQVEFNESPRLALGFSFVYVLFAVAIVSILFMTGQRYVGEVAFASAVRLDRASGELEVITSQLVTAVRNNRYNDVYYRNFAQAMLLRVGKEISGVDPSAITQEKSQLIQALVADSMNASKRATELAPNNVSNWVVRGAIAREVMPILSDAGGLAIEAFTKASELEPSNPAHLVDLARVYISQSEVERALMQSKDEEIKAQAQTKRDELLFSAQSALEKAIVLKADYAPAHYQLSLVYDSQGKTKDAIVKMESVKQYNPFDVGVAFQLGVLYLREDDLNNAKSEFERAIELLPDYSNARWFLAAVLEKQGDLAGALEQVKKVSELNPDNQTVLQKLAQLELGESSVLIPEPVEAGDQTATDVPEGQPQTEPVVE